MMKKYRFYIFKFFKIIILLIILYVIYNIVFHYISLGRLKENVQNSYKLGELLGVSESRINYISSYDLNKSPFSVEATVDSMYYVSCFRIGHLDKDKSLSDIIKLSEKPFSKKLQNDYLLHNNYVLVPLNNNKNPYTLFLNTRLFPMYIKLVQVYTEQDKEFNKDQINKEEISFITNAMDISFSFNGDNQEDMVVSSFVGDYKTNLLFCTDINNNLYVINISPITIDILDGWNIVASPFKTLKELREVSN